MDEFGDIDDEDDDLGQPTGTASASGAGASSGQRRLDLKLFNKPEGFSGKEADWTDFSFTSAIGSLALDGERRRF